MNGQQPNPNNSVLDSLAYPVAVVSTLVMIFLTAILSFVVLIVATLTRHRPTQDIFIVGAWSKNLLRLARLSINVRGQENVTDSPKGFLILFNHSSFMDIPVLFCGMPRAFNFGAKIELFRIPVFGRAMTRVGALPIDRKNRYQVLKVYESAMERAKAGECFALAPEGTRQKEPIIGKFKRGPFEFAIKAGLDVVPVVMAGVYEVMPRNSILVNKDRWRRTAQMEILPRISAAQYNLDSIEDLQNKVFAQMSETFARIHKEIS